MEGRIPVRNDGARYASCLLIDHDMKRALLIRKNRPEFQKGRLNIVGGGMELGEFPALTALRETGEEVGIELNLLELTLFCTLINVNDRWRVDFYKTVCDIDKYQQLTDEVPEVIDLDNIPDDVLYNLKWLIPMALDNAKCMATVYVTESCTP